MSSAGAGTVVLPAKVAAAGALAMLARDQEVAVRIAAGPREKLRRSTVLALPKDELRKP